MPDVGSAQYPLPLHNELVNQALNAMGDAASLLSLLGEHEKAVTIGNWRVEIDEKRAK